MKLRHIALIFLSVSLLMSCGGGGEPQEVTASTSLNFGDPLVQEIYRLQNNRDAKGLIPFLKAEQSTHRYLAAMAFASVQDTAAATIAALGAVLRSREEDESIRAVAAYALGQTGSDRASQPLLSGFEPKVANASFLVNAQILEAVGRCGDAKYLKYIAAAPNYLPTDTLVLQGQAFGIYRFSQRNIVSNLGTNRMLELLERPKYPETVRRIAANYFARLPQIVFDNPQKTTQLIALAQTEQDVYTRMSLAAALGKLPKNYKPLTALQDMFRAEGEPLIKVNILRSLLPYDYVDVKPIFLGAVRDANTQVATLASEYFVKNGIRNDVPLYYGIAMDSTISNRFLRINMLGAALANVPYYDSRRRNTINEQLKGQYLQTKDPYEKGQVLEVLSRLALNYQFIYDATFTPNQHPYVATAGINALANIRRDPKLSLTMGADYGWILEFFKRTFREVYEKGDAAMMATTAPILRDPALNYKAVYVGDYDFLLAALKRLKMPSDLETYHEIQKTLSYFNNDTLELLKPNNDYKIDWQPLKTITKDTKVKIETSKGDIIIQLYPIEAPGTVSNFLNLVKKGFYNQKTFHRVVPNFVAQGGGPRGDGYGSSDKLIRSEFSPLKYDDAGWVGVASAGKDTESCQFFITHSPTPHLDGRYTIFGKVVEGLSVSQNLQIGDKIKKITVFKSKK